MRPPNFQYTADQMFKPSKRLILPMRSTIHLSFTTPLLDWYALNGRKDLPWQMPRDPYRIWVSEIMLQQTQVKTVIPYFLRFMNAFPTIHNLARASEDAVLAHWEGLGYYSRARNLHKTAKIISEQFEGLFPEQLRDLVKLPGIGQSTAAAIASLAFNQPEAILDGNVKRVLSRYFLIQDPLEETAVVKKLWQLAKDCMPDQNCAQYTQAIMDLGATCCTPKNPNCTHCPLRATCLAKQSHLENQLPHKKIKQHKPVKTEQFILMHTQNHLMYLSKRPDTGIWGGLWGLPAIEISRCPLTYVQEIYHDESVESQKLLQIKHTFTHFHLHIHAISFKITQPLKTHVPEENGRWFTPQETLDVGLPKPVRTIIDYFLTEQSQSVPSRDFLKHTPPGG